MSKCHALRFLIMNFFQDIDFISLLKTEPVIHSGMRLKFSTHYDVNCYSAVEPRNISKMLLGLFYNRPEFLTAFLK